MRNRAARFCARDRPRTARLHTLQDEGARESLHSRHVAASHLAMATIIFDLDGTLVDSAPDLIDALNIILGREGLPPVAYEKARTLLGHGARR